MNRRRRLSEYKETIMKAATTLIIGLCILVVTMFCFMLSIDNELQLTQAALDAARSDRLDRNKDDMRHVVLDELRDNKHEHLCYRLVAARDHLMASSLSMHNTHMRDDKLVKPLHEGIIEGVLLLDTIIEDHCEELTR